MSNMWLPIKYNILNAMNQGEFMVNHNILNKKSWFALIMFTLFVTVIGCSRR